MKYEHRRHDKVNFLIILTMLVSVAPYVVHMYERTYIAEGHIEKIFGGEIKKLVNTDEKLKQFILQRNTFDKTAIARYAAEEYNLKRVGQQFLDLYKKIDN